MEIESLSEVSDAGNYRRQMICFLMGIIFDNFEIAENYIKKTEHQYVTAIENGELSAGTHQKKKSKDILKIVKMSSIINSISKMSLEKFEKKLTSKNKNYEKDISTLTYILSSLTRKTLSSCISEDSPWREKALEKKRISKQLEFIKSDAIFSELLYMIHSIKYRNPSKPSIFPSIRKIISYLRTHIDYETTLLKKTLKIDNIYAEILTPSTLSTPAPIAGISSTALLSLTQTKAQTQTQTQTQHKSSHDILKVVMNILMRDIYSLHPLVHELLNLGFKLRKIGHKDDLRANNVELGELIGFVFGVQPAHIKGCLGVLHGDYNRFAKMVAHYSNVEPKVAFLFF